MRVKFTRVLFIVTATIFSLNGVAQSSHYWTQQYGNKSLLLGGAVSGSVSDLGAVYYNPGFLALQENSAFVLTAKLLQFTNIKIESGLGENIDLEQNNLGNAPGLIAGIFEFKFLPKSKFAYVYLTRRTHDIDFIYRTQGMVDALPNSPGKEEFSSEIILASKSREYWGGWTWSYPLTEHTSIGVSNFFAITSTKSIVNIDLSAMSVDNHVVDINRKRKYEFLNYGMIWKLGYAIKYPNFTAGIAITAPKINIGGNGFMFNKNTAAGMDTNYTVTGEDYFDADLQEDIPVKLKSPLSIAIGAGYTIEKLTFHFSAEWFDKINKYTIMDVAPYKSQTSGKYINNTIVDELKSVVNAGVALEYKISTYYLFYAGFATDFSAVASGPSLYSDQTKEMIYSSFRANIYHFSGGLGMEFDKLHITLGMAYNYGIDYISRPVDLPDGGDGPIFESDETATLKVSNWKLLFGFSLPVSK